MKQLIRRKNKCILLFRVSPSRRGYLCVKHRNNHGCANREKGKPMLISVVCLVKICQLGVSLTQEIEPHRRLAKRYKDIFYRIKYTLFCYGYECVILCQLKPQLKPNFILW